MVCSVRGQGVEGTELGCFCGLWIACIAGWAVHKHFVVCVRRLYKYWMCPICKRPRWLVVYNWLWLLCGHFPFGAAVGVAITCIEEQSTKHSGVL